MRQSYHFEWCYSTNFNTILRNFRLHFKIFDEIDGYARYKTKACGSVFLSLFAVVDNLNRNSPCEMGTEELFCKRKSQNLLRPHFAENAHFAFTRLPIQALTPSKTEREEQRRRGRERQAPEFVRSCGCAVIFLHQRNEWHNERTSTYVRAVSVSPPEGFCG